MTVDIGQISFGKKVGEHGLSKFCRFNGQVLGRTPAPTLHPSLDKGLYATRHVLRREQGTLVSWCRAYVANNYHGPPTLHPFFPHPIYSTNFPFQRHSTQHDLCLEHRLHHRPLQRQVVLPCTILWVSSSPWATSTNMCGALTLYSSS